MVLCNVCVDLLLLINLDETIVVHPLTLLCHDFGVRLTQRKHNQISKIQSADFFPSLEQYFLGVLLPIFCVCVGYPRIFA